MMRQLKLRPKHQPAQKNKFCNSKPKRCNAMPLKPWKLLVPTLLVSVLLLTGCAVSSPSCKPASVEPVRVPQLAPAARQQPAPHWCSPTCTAAVKADSEKSAQRLTNLE